MYQLIQRVSFQRADNKMHVIVHHYIRQQAISLTIEVQQRLNYKLLFSIIQWN